MTKSPFLPEGYEPPATGAGHYTKLQPGANKLRILSSAVVGYLYWTVDKKPVRLHDYPKVAPANMRQEENDRIKHFWAFKVWNYATGQLEIMELTQATIQGQIQGLVGSDDWGDPRDYDITINKKGSGKETEYSALPSPKGTRSCEHQGAARDR